MQQVALAFSRLCMLVHAAPFQTVCQSKVFFLLNSLRSYSQRDITFIFELMHPICGRQFSEWISKGFLIWYKLKIWQPLNVHYFPANHIPLFRQTMIKLFIRLLILLYFNRSYHACWLNIHQPHCLQCNIQHCKIFHTKTVKWVLNLICLICHCLTGESKPPQQYDKVVWSVSLSKLNIEKNLNFHGARC